jgi:16S rRNA (guanine527-N7)-methyltransferase
MTEWEAPVPTGDEIARACVRAVEVHGVASSLVHSPHFQPGVARYLEILRRWNAKMNLTAVRNPHDALERHIVDSLVASVQINRLAGGSGSGSGLVDVGSGGGFPGAVLALLMPTIKVTLVESNHKKCAFLETLRRELPLPSTTIVCARAESLVESGRQFDLAISRATLALPAWLALGARLCRPGGFVIGMEGGGTYDLPDGAQRYPYTLGSAERAIIVMEVGADPR